MNRRAAWTLALLAVAFAAAALLAYAIWESLPDQLSVRTDIVGYSIHSNFNSYRYLWLYWLLAGFVPLTTLAVFLVLRRVVLGADGRPRPRPRRPEVEAPLRPPTPTEVKAVGLARVLFVAGVFALEAAAAISRKSGWILPIGLPTVAAYTLLVSLAAVTLGRAGRRGTTFWDRLALANAVGIPFGIAGLYAVSRSTEVKVLTTGQIHEYSWLPFWFAAGLTPLVLVWPLRAGLRASVGEELRALERRLLLVVAGPLMLLLLLAALPGAGGAIDMFHEGELLAGARLVEEGAFPWRDLIFIHGVLTDAGFQLLGFELFDHSSWGRLAGALVVIGPLYWVAIYYLCAYVFHRNWLFLVGTQLAVLLGVVVETNHRFIALPLVFVLLGALLSKPTRLRAGAFMALLVTHAIVTPEAGIAALAALTTVVAFEAYHYDRGLHLAANFRRTIWCAAAGAVLTAIWAAFLLAFGALDDFVAVSLEFASGHHLTGALPVRWPSDRYQFVSLAPAVLVVVAFSFFAVQIVRRASLRTNDWVMGGLALFVALYYHKFLARASDHGAQPYAVAVPLLFYVAYRLIAVGDEAMTRVAGDRGRRLPIRFPATALVLVALVMNAPGTIWDTVRNAPYRLVATVAEEPRTPAIGYLAPEGAHANLLDDVGSVLDANLEPEDAIFDFSNSPALFHFLLGRKPATRYYHVSLAIRKNAQEDLIDELEQARPKLVVFSSAGFGLPVWDRISNQVRHYLVSRYLLEHYVPLTSQEGYVFMVPKGSRREAGPNDLYFRTYSCEWGYAPNFLNVAPRAQRPLSVGHQALGPRVLLSGWAVDREARAPAAKVVAAVDGRVVAEGEPFSPRLEIAGELMDAAYLRSGFFLAFPPGSLPRGRLEALRVYALSRSGTAMELGNGTGADVATDRPAPMQLRLGRRRIPVVGSAEPAGVIDKASIIPDVVTLDLPETARRTAYGWLEVEATAPLHENAFVLSDHPAATERGISFATLPRGERSVRVMVGACSQWYGFRSGRLYLRTDRPEEIRAVRLYR